MKRVVVLMLLILSLSIISAAELEIKLEFKKSETLMAKLSGNFVSSVNQNNVFFYRGHVKIPLEFDITKINEEYYIYVLLPNPNETTLYTLSIEDIEYYQGPTISDEDIKANFTIINETADFYIKPGFINTQNDFSFQVQNLQPSKIIITIDDESVIDTLELKSGEIQDIDFFVNLDFGAVFKTITLSSEFTVYEIPTYIFSNKTFSQADRGIKFDPSDIDVTIPIGTDTSRIIYFENFEPIPEKIYFRISESLIPFVSLSVDSPYTIDPNDKIPVELFITSPDVEDFIQGRITIFSLNENETEIIHSSSDISLVFVADVLPVEPDGGIGDTPDNGPTTSRTCVELNGEKCDSSNNEACSEDAIIAKDGFCCVLPATCQQGDSEDNSIGKIIGWVIIVLIVIFLVWFLKKRYSKGRYPIDLLKVAKGKRK